MPGLGQNRASTKQVQNTTYEKITRRGSQNGSRSQSAGHDDVVALGVSLHFVQVEGQMVQNYGTKSRHEQSKTLETVQQFSLSLNIPNHLSLSLLHC